MTKVLITGGSGFLGRNLAIKLRNKYNIVLASRNNKNNFNAERQTGCPSVPLDISSIESCRDVIREWKPDIIIAAGATKFVQRSEEFPLETGDINIVGSQNIARVAIENNVKFVLGISTDKACNPFNIYGISKAYMERLFCLLNVKSSTQFSCVRYGNVAYSTGSVLPIWDQMHRATGVITTTGAEMRRFFFTIKEAVDLVCVALDNQELVAGQILSREMKSAKMRDILNVWIKNFGGKWEEGPRRDGDKDDEMLISDREREYTEAILINGITHYLLSPNTRVKTPLADVVSSANAPRLTESEILEILQLGTGDV